MNQYRTPFFCVKYSNALFKLCNSQFGMFFLINFFISCIFQGVVFLFVNITPKGLFWGYFCWYFFLLLFPVSTLLNFCLIFQYLSIRPLLLFSLFANNLNTTFLSTTYTQKTPSLTLLFNKIHLPPRRYGKA